MGLDVYAGTLTRYYLDAWKTVGQQWAEKNGYEFSILDRDGNLVERNQDMSEDHVESVNHKIQMWCDSLARVLKEDNHSFIPWDENLSKPYYTDKPDWIAYGALILCVAGKAFHESIPEYIEKTWNFEEDSLVKRAMIEDTFSSALTTFTTWWLPLKGTYSIKFFTPTDKTIQMGTIDLLFHELQCINQKLWQANEEEILRWNTEEGYPADFVIENNKTITAMEEQVKYNTQSLAKVAFSILWKAAKFSLTHKVPILLDPWEEMQERVYSALFDLQNEAVEYSQAEDNPQALKVLHGIENYLSRTEETFYNQYVYYLLGIVYQLVDDNEKALAYVQLSIEIERFRGDAYTLMGIIYKNQQDYMKSVEAFKKALLSQYVEGPEVFDEYEVSSVWHYTAVSMLYAYEEDKGYEIFDILRVLLEVIVLDRGYFNAYQNLAISFEELRPSNILSVFSKEHKLSKRLMQVAEKKEIHEDRYRQLLRDIADYIRNDEHPNLHYKLFFNGEYLEHIKPTFNNVREIVGVLWNKKEEFSTFMISHAFGNLEQSLTISVKQELATKNSYLEFNAKVPGEKNGVDDGQIEDLYKRVYDLTEAMHLLEEYFVFYERPKHKNWMTSEEYYKETIALIKKEVLIPFAEQTSLPYNRVYLTKEACSHINSKVGGNPYMPVGYPWPKSDLGTPLRFLAQINFEEMPSLPDFPKAGILQFYILENDEHDEDFIYGLNFDESPTKQNGFRVIYHNRVDEKVQQQVPPERCFNESEALLGKMDCLKINYEASSMAMTPDDYQFNETMIPLYNNIFGENVEDVWDLLPEVSNIIYDEFFRDGHRLGGYPYFTQSDPRGYGEYEDKDILLFQLDSDEVEDISFMWGDVGVANFFISREDLRNQNFTDVLYNWDCG